MALDSASATTGSFESAGGAKIEFRAWAAPGADVTFAVIHGMGEHSGRYERFAAGMAKHRMATYAVDLRGHGNSSGKRGHADSWSEWVEDAANFIALVESQVSTEVVPLGHSFGGVVMLSTVRSGRLPKATKRFVLSSPALRLKAKVPAWQSRLARMMSRVAPRLSVNNGVDAGTVSRIPEVVAAYRSDPLVHAHITARLYAEWEKAASENLAHAAEIKVPFLILAGADDRLVDSTASQELHAATPGVSELRLLEGRYHEPFNDLGADEVFAIIADWVRKQ